MDEEIAPHPSLPQRKSDPPTAPPPEPHASNDLPLWMQESSDSYKWRSMPLLIRKTIRIPGRFFRHLKKYSKGPREVQIQKIKPFFPAAQTLPLRLVERYLVRRSYKVLAVVLYWLSYAAIFAVLLSWSAGSGHVEGYGLATPVSCSDSLWHNDHGCGLNGGDCHPFSNLTIPFRCSASCKDTLLQEPYPIGGIEAVYTPLVIGGFGRSGTPKYRADSLICQAAIHAGVISNNQGGCGVVSLLGSSDSFLSSYDHELQSYGFDASFPKAFTFLTNISNDCESADIRWQMLIVAVLYTSIFSLFVSSPSIFFYPIFLVLFLFISIISDPPDVPDYSTRFSILVSRLVPTSFIAFVYYKYTVSRTLKGLRCQVEKTLLWLGGAWIGALNNYTFKDIPIQRLTPHDLGQAGAIPALIIIILILLTIAFSQAYYLWLEHRFRTYLALYGGFVSILLLGVAIPTHHVRIHHYLLAMIFLPGTSMQTRPSLFYQGLLIGLLLNGIARWGFAPLLETSEMLFAGLPELRPLPIVTSALASNLSRIAFSWSWPPTGYNGVSMLVNDVERYRWYIDNENTTFSWPSADVRLQKEYIRFAYIHSHAPNLEYTKAGIWDIDYTWSGIPTTSTGAFSLSITRDKMLKQLSASMFYT